MNAARVFYIMLLFPLSLCQVEKSSLAFVIDDTGSMGDDIRQVKENTNKVFDAVMKSNASHIENFVLVTFNDPSASLRTITKDRAVFKSKLAAINVYGGDDCPEMAMKGITLALENSKPGSNLYVFTDASAKDAYLLDRVQSMAIDKQAQIVFLLTGRCSSSDSDPQYQAYHKIAEATSGQVFHMQKNGISEVISFITESIKSRKSVILSKKFPPGYGHDLTFPVDSDMKELVVSVAGKTPKVDITAPDGSKPDVKKVVDLPEVLAVKITDTVPGNYTSKVGSKSETSVVMTATTDLQFKHGFSEIVPTSIKDTDARPIPGEKSYLAIQLQTAEEDKLLDSVEILDIKENVLMEIPLKLIDKEQKLYLTAPLAAPNHLFKIAVKGHDTKSKSSFKRVAPTPIEPQKPALVTTENKSPIITIDGGPDFEVEYNKPFKISCKVSGYPKPDIIWIDGNGSISSSAVSTVHLPYDYINILEIKKATTSSQYKCKAINAIGEAQNAIQLKVKEHFNVLEIPEDKTIKYKGSETIKCVVDANPPAKITWYGNAKELHTDDYIDISPDGSVLKIKDMRVHLIGNFICEARNDGKRSIFNFRIHISGFEKPVIHKTEEIVRVEKGKNVVISCSLIKGLPKPHITWFFQPQDSRVFNKIDEYGEAIHLKETDTGYSGTYKCIATNDAGQDSHETHLIVGYAPSIKPDMTRIIARQDEKTTLTCNVDGVPKPKVEWHLNGVKIVNSRNYHIYRDNSLRFTGSAENHGQYICTATNNYGSARRGIQVDFVVPVAIQPPKNSTLEVRLGEHLTLYCEADGYPRPTIKWLFYSSDTKTVEELRPSDVSGSLNMRSLQIKQDGYYTCIASNAESAANLTYQVKVLAPPYINKSSKTEFKAVIDDLVLTIPCKAIGIPKPDITWTKNGENIAAGTIWYDIERDGTLAIKNIDNKSSGAYVCHARNKLGSDSESHNVIVTSYPNDRNIPMKTIFLEEGADAELPCDIPHSRVDSLRWYKDGNVIARGTHLLQPVKAHHSGDYICHVSTFAKSSSAKIRVVVGFKPEFVTDPDIEIDLEEDQPALLDCEAYGIPSPKVTWTHNGKKIAFTEMLNEFIMTPESIGYYTCAVSNNFGSINRSFEIISQDCFLNIHEDFITKQPLMIEMPYSRLAQHENSHGHIRVPWRETVQLYCPSRFINFPKTEVMALCDRGSFEIEGNIYKYSDLSCREEIKPVIKKTGRECKSVNTELIKIGFEKREQFLEVYEICLDKYQNIPVYVKQKVHRSHADIDFKNNTKWFDDNLWVLKADEIYECAKQINYISSILGREFHTSDKCCFKDRQLVGPRDLLAGVSQKTSFTHLNVAPQWSTCGSQNWDHLENKVRNLAKNSYDGLTVWTGTSGQMKLTDSTEKYQIIKLRDEAGNLQAVPNYLWKVIQDPESKASLAVVQVNIPDLSITEAYRYMPCRDICRNISWLSGVTWRDPAKGFTFCCKLQDFERAFGYEGKFGDSRAILRDSFIFSSHSSL